MTLAQFPTVARILDHAWHDAAFKQQLLDSPRSALAGIGIVLPEHRTLRVGENTATLTYLVLTSPRYAERRSAYSEIKEFGECYRDPRLFPLNWGSHDPVFSRRIRHDPRGVLATFGLTIDEGHQIEVVENNRSSAYLVLPRPPTAEDQRAGITRLTATGLCPPAIRYASLVGVDGYQVFFDHHRKEVA